jgi:hypothetical protein
MTSSNATAPSLRERVLSLRDELAHSYERDKPPGLFALAQRTAESHGLDEPWLLVFVLYSIGRDHVDDNTCASAIASYARVALPHYRLDAIGDEERCAYIAARIALDFEYLYPLEDLDDVQLREPEVSFVVAGSRVFARTEPPSS